MAKPNLAEYDIYDFDNTIYDGDCSIDFWKFCVTRQKKCLAYLPYQTIHTILFAAKIENRTVFKEHFFIYLRSLENPDRAVNDFWDNHFNKIAKWYLKLDHSRDIIISASPDFIVRPAFEKLGAHSLIATMMDPSNGKINGENCRGEEKVKRLEEALGKPIIRRAYSDTLSDLPILQLAREPHIVKRGHPSLLSIPDLLD